jgi:hypothetical protein
LVFKWSRLSKFLVPFRLLTNTLIFSRNVSSVQIICHDWHGGSPMFVGPYALHTPCVLQSFCWNTQNYLGTKKILSLMESEGPCLYFFVYLMTLHEVLALVPPLATFLYQSVNRPVKRKISASLGNRTTAFKPILSHFVNWAMLPYPTILTEAKERAILAPPTRSFRSVQNVTVFMLCFRCAHLSCLH